MRERIAVPVKIGPRRYLLNLVPLARAVLLALIVSMVTGVALDKPLQLWWLVELLRRAVS